MLVRIVIALALALPAFGDEPPRFPAGTSQFSDVFVADAIAAPGGGVWLAVSAGIVRYTAAGAGTVLATPGGSPYSLAAAADGSIWFANSAGVGRISTSGTLLEQHPLAGVAQITVATDGALWYLRGSAPLVGRIAGGVPVEFAAPANVSSIAPDRNGAVVLLDAGFGTSTDSLHRMTPAGAVTTLPLHRDVLFGSLQTLANSTVYISTGIRRSLLRLRPERRSRSASPDSATCGFSSTSCTASGRRMRYTRATACTGSNPSFRTMSASVSNIVAWL